jgi:hypothetical protein
LNKEREVVDVEALSHGGREEVLEIRGGGIEDAGEAFVRMLDDISST